MLTEQLFQTIQNLEILRRLGWEVERSSPDKDALKILLKTATGKWWFRIDIDPQKDKPFRYFFSHISQPIESKTEREAAAWLLSDFCTFYALLLLQRVLEPIENGRRGLSALADRGMPPHRLLAVELWCVIIKQWVSSILRRKGGVRC
jgi:hypothetical protein